MDNASLLRRPGFSATLDPLIVQRRRALRIAPPAGFTETRIAEAAPVAAAGAWRDDLRFFLGCYVAGLVFFLILLS